ncbi:RNA polymerase sigma factor [Luteimonas sp. SX5]|uniref:RNA polymerase sigma factor n=1 Tax=Luteimonas galliterrae TaxID=2940486 RepID=A0ABT0ME98_9GAMM|nr:RNA polymerase sigma factor [Luteimonas galliterrae]MCL1633189.1 RNA polymerase sigma factor [Luteimonas galliterrae]
MPANPSPEEFQAAQRGDRAALERLLARSRQDLRRYAEYHCAVNDVEDAVQESLFLVARKIGHLRAIEAYASWLFRIVKRECNRLKRALRHLVLQPTLEEIDGPHYPPPDGLLRDLAGALQSMPEHYREIVLLRDYEGLTIAEISARLGLHAEAAKARLHRARGLARQLLSPPGIPLMPA